MPEAKQPLNLGDLLKYEAPNLYSREQLTLSAGQTLSLGAVVGIISASGKLRQLDPSATDGSQFAAGVLMQDCDAHLAERDDGLIIARHAILAQPALRWPTGITVTERQTAIAQLKSLGILVRQGV